MRIDPNNSYDRKRGEIYFQKLMEGFTPFSLTKETKKRTLNQNALFHLWVQVVADHVGYTSFENCKRDIKRTLIGTKEDVNQITGEIQQVDYRTSEMTTSELSSFMDKMKIWAESDLGCYLPYFGDPGYEEMVKEYRYK